MNNKLFYSPNEWFEMEKMVEVLEPIALICTKMESETSPTFSEIYPILWNMKNEHLLIDDEVSSLHHWQSLIYIRMKNLSQNLKLKLQIILTPAGNKMTLLMTKELAVTLNPRFKDLNFLGTELQGHAYNELLKKGKEHQKKYPVIEVVENQGVSDSRPLKRQKHDMMTLLYGTTISKSMLL